MEMNTCLHHNDRERARADAFCPVCMSNDSLRLEKLQYYLSDIRRNISPPEPNSPGWQFGFNAGDSYHIDAHGLSLREAIDQLPFAQVHAQ